MKKDQITDIKNWLQTGSINFFGLPFAGKDSQARALADLLDGVVISGGEILRSSASEDVKKLISDGHLAPTDYYIKTILPFFSRKEIEKSPLMLSAVGRWKGEELSVVPALDQSNHSLKAVIYLNLDTESMYHRLNLEENAEVRGERSDDEFDKLQQRVVEFNEKTLPVINYYREEGYLIEIDARLSKTVVTESIFEALSSLARQ